MNCGHALWFMTKDVMIFDLVFFFHLHKIKLQWPFFQFLIEKRSYMHFLKF